MKKIFIGLTLIFAGVMISCGGHKTEEQVDTTELIEVVEDTVICDSVVSDTTPVDSTVTEEAE